MLEYVLMDGHTTESYSGLAGFYVMQFKYNFYTFRRLYWNFIHAHCND
jgi:hypothetical protein